jgi:phosphatidylinositol alpha 1,6-mannosyltransferase
VNGPHPRIAFFPDAFHEVDGVAVVARNFAAYAQRWNIPFLMVHAGPCDQVVREGSVTRMQLRRSRLKFPLDRNHEFDLILLRSYRGVAAMLREFKPDIVQITGPSDIGILGALCAHNTDIPLAAFWQTNLPEYAGVRIAKALKVLPNRVARFFASAARTIAQLATMRFYRVAEILFAPNPEIVQTLSDAFGKPCFPMGHGVDANRFNPEFRDRRDGTFTIGYVGRLTSEKNVRLLAKLEHALVSQGLGDFRFLLVGHGAEMAWLRENLRCAEFPGVLRGDQLSHAFANMDVLAFPSETETFGLAVLEALASGVPVVAMEAGGPKYTVEHGKTGFVAKTFEEFASYVATLMSDPEMASCMRKAGRSYAILNSWDSAFQAIYQTYCSHLVDCAAMEINDKTRSLDDSVLVQPIA